MINEYRDALKRAYALRGKEAEIENQIYIDWLWERAHITYAQKEHLEKVNKNLGSAFK